MKKNDSVGEKDPDVIEEEEIVDPWPEVIDTWDVDDMDDNDWDDKKDGVEEDWLEEGEKMEGDDDDDGDDWDDDCEVVNPLGVKTTHSPPPVPFCRMRMVKSLIWHSEVFQEDRLITTSVGEIFAKTWLCWGVAGGDPRVRATRGTLGSLLPTELWAVM